MHQCPMLSISPEVSFSIKDEVMENLDRMVVSEFLDFIKNGSMSIFQDEKKQTKPERFSLLVLSLISSITKDKFIMSFS